MLKIYDLFQKPSRKDLLTYSNQLQIEILLEIDIDELLYPSGKIQKNQKTLSLQEPLKKFINEQEQDPKTLQKT